MRIEKENIRNSKELCCPGFDEEELAKYKS